MGTHAEQPRTHCRRGHALTSENVILGIVGAGKPHRVCRECHNAAQRRYMKRVRKGQR